MTKTSSSRPGQTVWTFEDLETVGDLLTTFEGMPKMVPTSEGEAIAFNGSDDGLYVPVHPLAGAEIFTIEAIFRPDGGAFEQRWLHLESIIPSDVAPGQSETRMLFEIRVVGDTWYLDAFMCGAGYSQALMDPDKIFPLGRWYHVAQTCDGKRYRSFVNGVLQSDAPLVFKPQGPGRASIGVRLNQVSQFKGAVREIRFTRSALSSASFTLATPEEAVAYQTVR